MKKNITVIIQIVLMVMFITSNIIMCHAAQKEYEYDDSGRVTKVTYEDGSYETYEYDKNGNIIQVTYTNAKIDSSEGGASTEGEGTDSENSATSTAGDGASSNDIETTEDNSSTKDDDKTENTGNTDNGQETDDNVVKDGVYSTGDTSYVAIFIVIMGIMLVGAYTVIIVRKREER